MDLVLPVHKAFIQAQFGLPSSNAVYYNFAIQGIFSLFYHMEDATLFLNTGASLSRAWSHTKDFSLQAHLSLLGRSVPQLSCSASIFISLAALLRITRVSCEYHLYERRLMFYGLEAIKRLFFFFLELLLFFSSAIAGIFSLSHSFLCLSLYFFFFFFYNPLIYSVQVIEVGTPWAKVIEAITVWTKPQFQVSLPSCPFYLDVRRIWAQQSSCHLWTPSL